MEMSKIQVQPTRRETGIKVSSGKLYGCKREWRLTSIRGRLPQERVINPGYEMSINVFSIQVPTFTRLSYATDRVRMGHGRRDIGVRCDVTLRGSWRVRYRTAWHVASYRNDESADRHTYQKHVNGNAYIKLLTEARVPHFRFTTPSSRLSCGAVCLGKVKSTRSTYRYVKKAQG